MDEGDVPFHPAQRSPLSCGSLFWSSTVAGFGLGPAMIGQVGTCRGATSLMRTGQELNIICGVGGPFDAMTIHPLGPTALKGLKHHPWCFDQAVNISFVTSKGRLSIFQVVFPSTISGYSWPGFKIDQAAAKLLFEILTANLPRTRVMPAESAILALLIKANWISIPCSSQSNFHSASGLPSLFFGVHQIIAALAALRMDCNFAVRINMCTCNDAQSLAVMADLPRRIDLPQTEMISPRKKGWLRRNRYGDCTRSPQASGKSQLSSVTASSVLASESTRNPSPAYFSWIFRQTAPL